MLCTYLIKTRSTIQENMVFPKERKAGWLSYTSVDVKSIHGNLSPSLPPIKFLSNDFPSWNYYNFPFLQILSQVISLQTTHLRQHKVTFLYPPRNIYFRSLYLSYIPPIFQHTELLSLFPSILSTLSRILTFRTLVSNENLVTSGELFTLEFVRWQINEPVKHQAGFPIGPNSLSLSALRS